MPTEETQEVMFMTKESAAWTYSIVDDDHIILNGVPFHQKGKQITLIPGQAFRTSDPQIIEGLRNHRKYLDGTILEYGKHFGVEDFKKEKVKVTTKAE